MAPKKQPDLSIDQEPSEFGTELEEKTDEVLDIYDKFLKVLKSAERASILTTAFIQAEATRDLAAAIREGVI